MRLNEVALLTFEDLKVDEDTGIRFFDLTNEAKLLKNNAASRRQVPVPDQLVLPAGQGRLFDYPKDIDGKSQNAASFEHRQICWVKFYSATSSLVFGVKINIPPVLAVTSNCSFFTSPVRSKTSRAAEIALRAPIADGSSRASTIPNAAFGAFIASIILALSVISSLSGPTTSAVLVVREYPAKSMAALICPRASLSRASRKSSCLGLRVFS